MSGGRPVIQRADSRFLGLGVYDSDSDDEEKGEESKHGGGSSRGLVSPAYVEGGEREGMNGIIMSDIPPDIILSHEAEIVPSSSRRSMRLLPPEPEGEVDPSLQAKIQEAYKKKAAVGYSFNESLFRQKEFHNPDILTKLADYHNIDPIGSNYPRSQYDPHEFSRADYYDDLARIQRIEEDKKAEERKKEFARTNSMTSLLTGTLPLRPPTPGQGVPNIPIPLAGLDGGLTEAQIAAAKSKAKAAAAAAAAAIGQEFSKKAKENFGNGQV